MFALGNSLCYALVCHLSKHDWGVLLETFEIMFEILFPYRSILVSCYYNVRIY